jgi:hypothetical protein
MGGKHPRHPYRVGGAVGPVQRVREDDVHELPAQAQCVARVAADLDAPHHRW